MINHIITVHAKWVYIYYKIYKQKIIQIHNTVYSRFRRGSFPQHGNRPVSGVPALRVPVRKNTAETKERRHGQSYSGDTYSLAARGHGHSRYRGSPGGRGGGLSLTRWPEIRPTPVPGLRRERGSSLAQLTGPRLTHTQIHTLPTHTLSYRDRHTRAHTGVRALTGGERAGNTAVKREGKASWERVPLQASDWTGTRSQKRVC